MKPISPITHGNRPVLAEEALSARGAPALLVSGDRDLLVEDIPMLKSRYGAVAGVGNQEPSLSWQPATGFGCSSWRGVTDLVGSSGGEAYGNLELFEGSHFKDFYVSLWRRCRTGLWLEILPDPFDVWHKSYWRAICCKRGICFTWSMPIGPGKSG